jgi:fructan beta-fructosidase
MKLIYPLLAASLLTFNPAIAETGAPQKGFHYADNHRPQFHFTPQTGWMNDPNGMVYYQGEYHLFFQHYPDDTKWGPMHWGHAVSKDMVHWEQLPIALYPDQHGWIFSGSAVLDKTNSSGLGTADNPPLVAIFTYHNNAEEKRRSPLTQTQGIAYSLDKGRSWTPYANNPVLKGPGVMDFRDPKVSWYEPAQKWIMTLAVQDRVSFYSSKNLINWQHESDFGKDIGGHGGVWECPDLIKLPVADGKESKYALLVSINPGGPNGGSATQYFVGDFDGSKFTLDARMTKQLARVPADFPKGKVFEDFESDFGNWTATGDAFAAGPIAGGFPGQKGVEGFTGNKLLNSFNNQDSGTGRLTSKAFKVESPYINFLIGGGNMPGKLAVNLLVDGKPVLSTTGPKSEKLAYASWDVRAYQGKEVRIEVVDEATGDWGHINLDQIVFAKSPAHAEQQPAFWLDYGTDNYAGVTWSNLPAGDGRQLFIGWMSNWAYANEVPTDAWRSAMTIPRSLHLRNTRDGYRVASLPAEELKSLRGRTASGGPVAINNTKLHELAGFSPQTYELELQIDPKKAKQLQLELANHLGEKLVITLDRANNQLVLDRTQAGKSHFNRSFASKQLAPLDGKANRYELRLYQDASSTEVFINKGETVMTALVFPNEEFGQMTLTSDAGAELSQWSLHQLKSAWQ